MRTRWLARAGAVTLVAGTVGSAALVVAEAVAARVRRYAKPDPNLRMRTSIGDRQSPALRLVLLGDSSALGVGVDRVADTVGGHLAELLAGSQATGGRRIARAQAEAVHEAGGIPVDLAARAGAVFRADPGTLSYDGLHPSADGYRVWAHALYPAVAEAAGVVSH